MTDPVVTVIELPVGAIAPDHRGAEPPLVVLPVHGAGAHRTVAGACRRAAAVVEGPSGHPRSTTVTRCLDATERLRHHPTDRQQAQRLTGA